MVERLIVTEQALISARVFLADTKPGRPLLVGIHGGGFTASYHDSGPYSLRELANTQGFNVILLERPGYGRSHFKDTPTENLHANAAILSEAIGVLWQEYGGESAGIYLVGHSIGGAIALMMAAASRDWPLAAVSVSGIGVFPPPAMPREGGGPPSGQGAGQTYAPMEQAMLAKMFFAPGAASDEAMHHMAAASFPVIVNEVQSIYGVWAPSALETLKKIREPVQFILAEHDSLWLADDATMAEIGNALGGSVRSDVRIFPKVGHCIDYHAEHADFHQQILEFFA